MVDADHLQVLHGDPPVAHVSGHLLALEHPARILAIAGRAVRAVRNRHAVTGAQPLETPALHGAGEALADAGAAHIDVLADHEMIDRKRGAGLEQRVLAHPELGEPSLGRHLGLGEVTAHRLGHGLGLGATDAELHRGVAIPVGAPGGHHLAVLDPQHAHGHMAALGVEQPGHAELLGEDSGTHGLSPRPRLRP
jgi:hypothetical protein